MAFSNFIVRIQFLSYLFTRGRRNPGTLNLLVWYTDVRFAGLYFIHPLLNSSSISQQCLSLSENKTEPLRHCLFTQPPATPLILSSSYSCFCFYFCSCGSFLISYNFFILFIIYLFNLFLFSIHVYVQAAILALYWIVYALVLCLRLTGPTSECINELRLLQRETPLRRCIFFVSVHSFYFIIFVILLVQLLLSLCSGSL